MKDDGCFHVGLDLSITSTGYCIAKCTGEIVRYGDIKSGPKDGNDVVRFDEIASSLIEKLFDYQFHLVAIESYAYSMPRGRGNPSRIAELGGTIKNQIYNIFDVHLDHGMILVSPGTIKKYATGKGNSDKSIVNKHVFKKWAFDTDSDDIADAFVISKMCCDLWRYMNGKGMKCEHKYEHECMLAMAKQNGIKLEIGGMTEWKDTRSRIKLKT